jgi:exosortase
VSESSAVRRGVLWLAAAGLLVAYAPTLVWLWGRWTMSVWHNAHGLMIPPVVGYFVYQELKSHASLPRGASAWGFAFAVPALALLALDAGMHTELLAAVSLVLLMPGLSLLLLGWPRTRAILFPLVFLAFALPIPLAFTERLHLVLRQVTTAATATLVPYLGIPVFTEATTLHMPNGVLQVADACSGFSTLYAALAIACLVAYSAHERWRKILVIVAAAPLAVGANILRVTLLVVLVEWKGAEILETFIHPLTGIMTFAIALPIILWIGLGGHPGPKEKAS